MKNKSTPPSKNGEPKSETADDATKIESEIEKTRASMSDTLDQLHGKLNPSVLKDQALDQFQQAKEAIKSDVRSEIEDVKGLLRKELAEAKSEFREATIGKVEHMVDDAQQTVTETSNTLLSAIRENPIPAALVGIGIGWLFINARARGGSRNGNDRYLTNGSSTSRRRSVEGVAGELGQRASRLAHQATDRAGSLLHSAEDHAGSLAHSVQNQAKHVFDQATEGVQSFTRDAGGSVNEYAGRAKSTALSVANDARDTAVQWEGTVERSLRENPLPLGAIALALGVAAGLAIPSTRLEDQWVGQYRDRAIDEAEELAEQALGTIESGAKRLVENAKPSESATT